MFSDSHFHLMTMDGGNAECGKQILSDYADLNPAFGVDIGTKCGDLSVRVRHAEECLSLMDDEKKSAVSSFLCFTAGIWPSVNEIKTREESIRTLEKQICDFEKENHFKKHIVAIGECGLDHHWNPSNPDARTEDDFDDEVYAGERELFLMQIQLAKKLDLPVIVHSRDAFDETLSCIDEAGWHNGIIHCYSYGIEEARKFIDRGWYIAFGGGTTYTKKSRMEDMKNLLRYVPSDRILLETDAPYLSPVPLRGKPNVPVNVRFTYEFIASCREVSVEDLCGTVDENLRILFGKR
ncbi:MAG: TatD family hydrolase [Treponema sp.]|nr:TatD family hydrolase [Treponema sp.]